MKFRRIATVLSIAVLGLIAALSAPAAIADLGATRTLAFDYDGFVSYPVSGTARWVVAIDSGGADDQDASTITNPTSSITASTRHVLNRNFKSGTTLVVRLGYDAGAGSLTNPVIKVFGRSGGDAWQILRNKSGSLTATITTATSTDVSDGTYKYTVPDLNDNAWDCQGCDQILIGVETAFAAGSGTAANAFIQAKMF